MKKRIFLFTVVLLILSTLFIISASAHPGRTDANGGHWDHGTGDYHYHTGEYAGRGSSGSSSYKSSSSFKPPYDPPAKDSSLKSSSDNTWTVNDVICIILGSLFGLATLYFLVLSIYGLFLETLLPKFNINVYEKKLNELSTCLKELADIEEKLKNLEPNLHIPDEYEIGQDGLPKEKGSAKWGDIFTLYVSYRGSKLHVKSSCCSFASPVHVYTYRNYSNSICKKCGSHYKMPDMSWYDNHFQYHSLNTKYKSLQDKPATLRQELFNIFQKCNSKLIKFLLFFNKKQRQTLSDLNKKYQTYTSPTINK